jgi:exopolysaccharide biosynthesis polyprenyl glycosylphosphotransferase
MKSKKIHINEQQLNHQYGYRFVKRLFDMVASAVALVILSPLLLIIAICIKVDDPKGPVFYSQVRVGKDGKHFKMFKFRSMVTNADQLLEKLRSQNDVDGAMFKMKNDPRITKVGRIIRKYSLDELPQLANVVMGSMSIVGPRPPLVSEVAEYTDYDKQRLMVKPGATGMWQVGGRNDVSFDEMVALDLTYIQERSIWLDLKIMFETVKIMIIPNGAY